MRKFLLLFLIAGTAFATQEPASKSNPVVIASDQSSLWVQVGVPTQTPTFTYTSTPTYTPTGSATPTYTRTNTYTSTPTYTKTPTFSPTPTLPFGTNTFTPVATATNTNTYTNTPTYTSTPTYTPTGSATPTYTSTATYTPSPTSTATPTWTPWVPLTLALGVQSVTPTPVNTPITGQITGLIVDSMCNNGTAQDFIIITRNNTIIYKAPAAPAGGCPEGSMYFPGNGNDTWGFVSPSVAGAAFNVNYRLWIAPAATPPPSGLF